VGPASARSQGRHEAEKGQRFLGGSCRWYPLAKVIVVSGHSNKQNALSSVAAGAYGAGAYDFL
jgi:hypothetical protein